MIKPDPTTLVYYDFILDIFYIGEKYNKDLLHYPDENGRKHNFIQWVDEYWNLDEDPIFDITEIEEWNNIPKWAQECINLLKTEFGTEYPFWG